MMIISIETTRDAVLLLSPVIRLNKKSPVVLYLNKNLKMRGQLIFTKTDILIVEILKIRFLLY